MMYQGIAVLWLLIFYGCYCLKMLFQRKKGIQTDQLGKGKTGICRWIEWMVKIASILCLSIEIGSILWNVSMLSAVWRSVGACVGAVGVVLFIQSVFTMKENWRAGVASDEQTQLVTTGIYRISRNPAFLAFDLVYLGILLMFFHVILLFVSCLAAVLLHLQIVLVEEPFLRIKFGEEYRMYQQHTCRYWGRK